MKTQRHGSAWASLILGLALGLAVDGVVQGHGDLHESIDAVTAEIARQPENAALYLKRAELRRLHHEEAAATADYDAAERLNPQLAEVHLGRGKLLFHSGKLEAARKALDRFLEKVPAHADATLTRARVESQRNRHLSAAKDYARVLELTAKPEPEHFIEYARALKAAGPSHIPKALAVLDRGMEKLGPIPTLGLVAVELELARGDHDAALARLDRISAPSGRKDSWLEQRGDILQKAGRSSEALAHYREALQAIEKLPQRVRNRKATAELEARLRSKLTPKRPR